jgi:serine/threonine protein phosphatase PrpC
VSGAWIARCRACDEPLVVGDEFCEACGHAVRADHEDVDLGYVAAVSDRGLVHRRNEDSFALAARGNSSIAVVCDGVSSSFGPHFASWGAAEVARRVLEDCLADDTVGPRYESDARDATARAIEAAQAVVSDLAFAPGEVLTAPACTLVSALWDGQEFTIGSVGDSRAYWVGKDDARCLTTDDSWMRAQVAHGLATQSEAERDARAHAITHWIGADAPREPPEVVSFRAPGPGHLVVCTDGLWNYLPTATELAAAVHDLGTRTPAEIARALVRTAIARGGVDNVTVAVVEVCGSTSNASQPVHEEER